MSLVRKGIHSWIVEILTDHLLPQSQGPIHTRRWSLGEKMGFLWSRKERHASWPWVLYPLKFPPRHGRSHFFSDWRFLWAATQSAASLSPWTPQRQPIEEQRSSSPLATALGTDLFCFQSVSMFCSSDLHKDHFNLCN